MGDRMHQLYIALLPYTWRIHYVEELIFYVEEPYPDTLFPKIQEITEGMLKKRDGAFGSMSINEKLASLIIIYMK